MPSTQETQRKVSQSTELHTAPKRQSKSSATISHRRMPDRTCDSIPVRPPRTKKITSAISNVENTASTSRPKYKRSHTFIETRKSRGPKSPPLVSIPRSICGLPLVTANQRHTLSLLRLNDIFSYGINGTLRPCTTAKNLCLLLIDFVRMITTAKRKLLEQRESYYKMVCNEQGLRKEVEMSKNQQRAARKKVVDGEIFSSLPGKLDHATCCAWKVPFTESAALSVLPNYTETNF